MARQPVSSASTDTIFWSQELVHDGELGRDGIWDGDGDGPTVALEKGCSCRQARPLQSVEVPARGAIPGPSLDLLDLQADQSSGLAHLSSGAPFFPRRALQQSAVPFCAPLSIPSDKFWRLETTPSPSPSPPFLSPPLLQTTTTWISSSSSYSILTLYLPTTRLGALVFVPSHLGHPVCLSPRLLHPSKSLPKRVPQGRFAPSQPSHRLHLPDSSACGRVA